MGCYRLVGWAADMSLEIRGLDVGAGLTEEGTLSCPNGKVEEGKISPRVAYVVSFPFSLKMLLSLSQRLTRSSKI